LPAAEKTSRTAADTGENIYRLLVSGYEMLASGKTKETQRKFNQGLLTFWRRNYFFKTLAHPVYKI